MGMMSLEGLAALLITGALAFVGRVFWNMYQDIRKNSDRITVLEQQILNRLKNGDWREEHNYGEGNGDGFLD